MIHALAPDRSDQPFGRAILPRQGRRYRFVADARGAKSTGDNGAINLIPIANEVTSRSNWANDNSTFSVSRPSNSLACRKGATEEPYIKMQKGGANNASSNLVKVLQPLMDFEDLIRARAPARRATMTRGLIGKNVRCRKALIQITAQKNTRPLTAIENLPSECDDCASYRAPLSGARHISCFLAVWCRLVGLPICPDLTEGRKRL